MTAVAGFRFLRLPRNVIGVLLGLLACSMPLHAATITVTSAADADALDGGCTLREAITAINNGADYSDCTHSGAAFGSGDTIAFNIPGSGVRVIQPATDLPGIVSSVAIDGYTQPGALANTNAGVDYPNIQGTNADIRVELDGSGVAMHGLMLGGAGSVVRGLSIVNFTRSGIFVVGTGSRIVGNFVGVHADGTTTGANGSALGNPHMPNAGVIVYNSFGIQVGSSSSAADRNLIAGNQPFDVIVDSTSSTTLIAGNLVGTDRSGSVALSPRMCVGFGGTGGELQRNLIAGCATAGVLLMGADADIHDNVLGMGVGQIPLSNGTNSAAIGIVAFLEAPAVNNRLHGNRIANSSGDGILVVGSATYAVSGNRLDGNWIWNSSGLGINLQPDGEANFTVTNNDAPAALDADAGPNGLQNFPVATVATIDPGGTAYVVFTLDSAAGRSYLISAYANDACSASGYGQGQYPAGSVTVTTDGNGHAVGLLTVPAGTQGWALGQWVSLLATDSAGGDTSEFSACRQLVAGAAPAIPPSAGTAMSVPTLSEWALILLSAILALGTLVISNRMAQK